MQCWRVMGPEKWCGGWLCCCWIVAQLDSERFKEIITIMKEGSDLRSRDLFHPIRLALAGKAGEGELDRVILLIDEAAALPFAVPVKSARARILEFCSAFD